MNPSNELVALVGPHGAGKSTLILALLGQVPGRLGIVMSETSRPKRESNDVFFYRFRTREEMLRAKEEGRYLQVSTYVKQGVEHLYADNREHANDILEKQVGIKALTEEGVINWRAAGYRIVMVRVVPRDNPVVIDASRAAADAVRERIPLTPDLMVVNSFAPGGKERALAVLRDFLYDSVL